MTYIKNTKSHLLLVLSGVAATVLLVCSLWIFIPQIYGYFRPSVTDFKITKYERNGAKLRIWGTMTKADDGCKYVGPSVYDITNQPAELLKTSRQKAGKIRLPGSQEWGPTTIYGIPADAKKLEYSMTHNCGFYTKVAKYQIIDLESVTFSPWEP